MDTFETVVLVSIVVGLVLIISIGFLITRKSSGEGWKEGLRVKYKELVILSQNSDIIFVRSAVMDADKLLDNILLKYLLPGNTMGERLSNAHSIFSDKANLERAWRGHKVRNSLAHDMTFNPDIKALRYAFADLSAAINDLLD
jgi:hypothetical protein